MVGQPIEDVRLTLDVGKEGATGPDGNAEFVQASPPGSIKIAGEREGYMSSQHTANLPALPPFRAEASLSLCPIPDSSLDGAPLLVARVDDGLELVSVRHSSVVDEHAGSPYFGADEFAVNAAWYRLDGDAPVLPYSELEESPSVGPLRRLYVSDELLNRSGNTIPGALIGRVMRTEEDGTVPDGTWKTEGLYYKPADSRVPRTGGIVGLKQLAHPRFDSGRFEVWTQWQTLRDMTVRSAESPPGYSLVEILGPGDWAVVAASGAKPWKIYPLKAP